MAIGNKNYVRKHYPEVVKAVEQKYDEIERRYRELCPRAQKGRVQIALERHVSAHTWAWHGIRAYKWNGQVNCDPASFYGGYAYIIIEDIQDILDDLDKEEKSEE